MRTTPLFTLLLVLSLAACQATVAPRPAATVPPAPTPPAAPTSPAVAPPPAAPAPPAVAAPAPRNLAYQCGDRRVGARIDGDAIVLALPGRELRLPQQVSASGTRYADGEGSEFWSKGAEARLTLDGGKPQACALTDAGSPWDDAKARGVGFRAVGSEPGWSVEVDRGNAPAMRAVLDYGRRRLDVPATQPFGDPTNGEVGFRGNAAGTPVELRIRREACTDAMSGETFNASADLGVGGTHYRGCGRFLF
ncbi:MAG: MliC family protein [Mizugakiibacter sp.]|uniref:MliC family protein n=1 Tax=Mizugakiibacter sp. TaxID=1972610 RepID=UPI0031C4A19F|nr:MliC family protein [Xanthomonadaceae bacterium]